MTKKSYRAIFISPHLDDAVFSCGGTISLLKNEGSILVINIFTNYLTDKKYHGIVMSEERKAEEKKASEFLGYDSINLDELDAIFRHKDYENIKNIFYPPNTSDLKWIPQLREKLFSVLEQFEYQELYIPLGIGWHVDHILTYLAFEPWFGKKNILFYEDTPYCTIPNTSQYRLNEIANYSANKDDITLKTTFTYKAWWLTVKEYCKTPMMKNLKPWYFQKMAVPVVAIYLKFLLTFYRKRVCHRNHLLNIRINYIEKFFDYKIKAMSLYASQIKEFFFNQRHCEDSLKSYARNMQYGSEKLERFWYFEKFN